MNIEIRSNEVLITEAIKSYLEKRVIESLEKFYKGDKIKDVFVSIEVVKLSNSHNKGDQYKVSANIISRGEKVFFVESTGLDLYAIIDNLKNKIINIIVSTHGKKESLSRRMASQFKKMFKRSN